MFEIMPIYEETPLALQKAFLQHSSRDHLRGLVEELLQEGYAEETILNEFERFRGQSQDDPYEDVLLEVMDLLTGWCSPRARMKKPERFKQSPANLAISAG